MGTGLVNNILQVNNRIFFWVNYPFKKSGEDTKTPAFKNAGLFNSGSRF